MKNKLLIACVVIVLGILAFGTISASADTEGIFTYSVSEGEATITDCSTSASGDITIPSTLGGYPVTSIGDYAFRDCTNLTSITIPDCVISIGDDAFYNCKKITRVNITDITAWCNISFYNYFSNPLRYAKNLYLNGELVADLVIPEGVTSIGERAFYNCTNLTSIEIPDSVTSIGSSAFDGCTSLTSIEIPDSVTSIGDEAFYGCTRLTSITIPDSVTSIGDCAFLDCTNLTSIKIPDGVISIGDAAFYCCRSLTSIKIPDSVTSIGYQAFYGCRSLTSIEIPDSVTSIGSSAFYGCRSLTSITIPNSVTSIGSQAFLDCTNLTSIEIPDSVTSIGSQAFRDCTNLTSIEIPDSITSIGSSTFYDCTSLTSIEIPDSVTSIGDFAFYNCRKLTSIKIPDGVISIGDNAFYRCDSLESITIPDSVTSIGSSAFDDCTNLTSVTVPDSVTSIGDDAFYNCKKLTRVNITDITAWCNISFSSYNSNPLYYAKKLYLNGELVTDLVIPEGVTSIGKRAFYNCTSLTSITIPDSVTSIGSSAFYNCYRLTSVTIGNSVTSIGYDAFYNCTSLKSVTIPDSVTNIGSDAFSNTGYYNNSANWENNVLYIGKYLISVKTSVNGHFGIKDGTIVIAGSAFSDCTSLTSIEIPDSVTSIGSSAFYGCTSLTSIEIPDSVTSIGDYAFSDCTSLTSIEIPDSVTSIGDYAFSDCTSLTRVNITDITAWCNISFYNYYSNPLYYANNLYLNGEPVTDIVIPKGVTSIGDYAFLNCTSLTSIKIPDGVTSIGSSAFDDCTNLTSVTVSDSVTSIGDYAFYNCKKLTNITISDCVKSIGSGAFSNTGYYNNSANWENDVLYIGKYLISVKTSVNGHFGIKDGTIVIAGSAFSECASLTSITIPDSVTSIGSSAFSACTSLTSIEIPDSVTSIGSSAFGYCRKLTSIKIPNSVTSIGDYAFSDCTSLTSIKIPDSVTSIGDEAFYACVSIDNVYYSGTEDMWNKISIGSGNSYLTSANKIYLVNIKVVCETGEEISFFLISGNAIDASSIPQKQYHTPIFYKDENRTEKISVDTPISESITLYLGYEPILYTHIFLDDDGNVLKTESVPFGTVIVPPEVPTKEATDEYTYTFAGWKDFTSGMTQEDIELVFVAQYDAVRNDLEQFKMVCDDSVEIGANIDLTASFATNISAQYIYMTVGIPDGFAVRELTPIDFAEISLDSEEHKNGYTYFTYLGIYDYNGAEIPKNAKVLPFKMEIGVSKDVIAGEYPIIVSEATLINNEGSFIPFENMRGVTITVKPKLAESITLSGPSSIDKPTSFTATVYPDYTSNKEVLWSVSDETVAEINENGLLTPIKNGTVIVSATAADGSGCVASKSVEIIKYAEITSLSSDVGMWDKAFSPDVYEYTIAVFGDVSSITLTPTFNGGVLRPNGTGLWISGTKKSFALGEDITTITLVRQNVTDNADSTYTINVVKAKSEFDGAQIRTDDPQGLRFIFSIPRAVYDAIEHPESPDDKGIGFGSVVMPKKYLGDNELTKETSVTINNKVYKSKIAPAVNLFDVTEDEVKFTACLIEIPEKNYEEEYVAVPYMTYIENGEEITIYGEKTEGVTVFTIAEMAYADSTVSDDVKKYLFDNILTVVRPDKYHKEDPFDYAILLTFDEEPVTKYDLGLEEEVEDDRIVYAATGVVNGEFVTYYYVNVVIDGAKKAVKLADYANTFVSYDGKYSYNENLVKQKITDQQIAETVLYNDFLNKFSTYTVDSDGAYTFTAIDFAGADEAATIFADKDEEGAVYLAAASASIKNFTGSIYNVTGIEGISKFTLKDYSKLIIKTVDDEGEDVYTVYTSKTLPDFAETTFTNVMSVFVNNTASSYENLGILYAELDEFNINTESGDSGDNVQQSKGNDYRIVVGAQTIVDETNKEREAITVLNITDGTKTSGVYFAEGSGYEGTNRFVIINEEGEAVNTNINSYYVKQKIFKTTFGNYYTYYDPYNKFLEIGDGNTYVITDDTTFLYYTSTSVYQTADDDILTVEDNSYEGLEEAASFTLYIVADEIDDKNTDDSIKTVKTIVVTK